MDEWYFVALLLASLPLLLGLVSILHACRLYSSGGKPFMAILVGFISCGVGICIAGKLDV